MPTRLYFRSALRDVSAGIFTGNGFPVEGTPAGTGIEGTVGCILYDIATDGTKYIAIGDSGLSGSSIAWQAYMVASNNLDHGWTRVNGAFDSDTDALAAVCYANGLWVTGSDTGKIFTSPTGESGTWTLRFTPTVTDLIYRIRHLNGVFISVTRAGRFATSIDGITWTERTLPGVTFNITNVEYSVEQAKYVFCGSAGGIAITTDFVNVTVTNYGATNTNAYGLVWSASLGLWVATGSAGTIRTSPTALAGTWTARTSGTSSPLTALAYDGTTFVATGDLRTTVRSTNATSWTAQSFTSDTGDFWAVRSYTPGHFVALTEYTPALIWESKDSGVTWQPVATEKSNAVQHAGLSTSKEGLYSPDAIRLRTLSTSPGPAQRATTITTVAATTVQSALMFIGASEPLASDQTVGGGPIILNAADSETNLNVNFWINAFNAYVWRPSTGQVVGYIRDAAATSLGGLEPTVAGQGQVTHITGITSSAVAAKAGDVIYVEVWARFTQGMATAYNASFLYDGTTVNTTENAVVTNHASFIEFTENLTFGAPPPAAGAVTKVWTGSLWKTAVPKVWTGSAWVTVAPRRWGGTVWA